MGEPAYYGEIVEIDRDAMTAYCIRDEDGKVFLLDLQYEALADELEISNRVLFVPDDTGEKISKATLLNIVREKS